MKERQILFSTEMVRAIMDGSKTQTRRVKKSDKCPYGHVGDVLWVRETWQLSTWLHPSDENYGYIYKASDNGQEWESNDEQWKWKPSIFMPRKACRLRLQITDIRVERLQDITEEYARAEGLARISKDGGRTWKYGIPDTDGLPGTDDNGWEWREWNTSPVSAFKTLWGKINGPGWDANPYVWVISFKKYTP